jgi:hypothetical protein
MNYLAYGEVVEGSGWINRTDLESIKGEWCISMRIFEVPDDFDFDAFIKEEKPRFKRVVDKYKLVYEDGPLMHEKI